jgi:3-oxoacyl-[acyl-carrier protein] reductase
MELRGTVAVVTGGGTGIGRAVGEHLARVGAAAVVVNYSRSAADAEATASALAELGCRAQAVQADVSDETSVRTMVERTVATYGRLDILVNNAGTTRFIAFPDLDAVTDQTWDELLGVNLKGPFYCARAAAAALTRARGAIVNVASIAGHRGVGSSLPYGVSKAALLQLTRGLAVALAPEVRVNAVSPGLVETRWHTGRLSEREFHDLAARQADETPLGQIASPEHVAQAVMGLLASDMVTGESIIVDGGKHLLY